MGITKKAVCLLLGGAPAIGAGALIGAPWVLFWAYNAALFFLFWLDVWLSPRRADFAAQRTFDGAFELRRESVVRVTVFSRVQRPVHLRLCDAPPESFEWAREIAEKDCPPAGSAALLYAVRPTLRGIFRFGGCHIEVRGRMGLCVRQFVLPCPGEAPVYPDLGPMRKYRLLAARRQLNRDDLSAHRVRGVGSEFAGIREYTPDDDTRKINWMATARTGKPMTNIFDVERNQQIMLAVDMGRWMDAPMGEVTRLDRAVELAAAMAQVALSSGDRVGLVLFDAEVRSYLKPGKGTAHMNRVLELLYMARTSRCESSLFDMSAFVSARMRHRGLVCVFSYLDGEEAAQEAGRALFSMGRRHAVLYASLADPTLAALSDAVADSARALYDKAAAIFRVTAEQEASRTMQSRGIACLSAEPSRLLSLLVRRYMSMKQQLKI